MTLKIKFLSIFVIISLLFITGSWTLQVDNIQESIADFSKNLTNQQIHFEKVTNELPLLSTNEGCSQGSCSGG